MYAFHLRPRGSNGTVAVRLIVVVWPVRPMHRDAVLVLLAAETSLSGTVAVHKEAALFNRYNITYTRFPALLTMLSTCLLQVRLFDMGTPNIVACSTLSTVSDHERGVCRACVCMCACAYVSNRE